MVYPSSEPMCFQSVLCRWGVNERSALHLKVKPISISVIPGKTEANEAGFTRRIREISRSRSTFPTLIMKWTAAQYRWPVCIRSLRIGDRLRWIVAITVLTPFAHIAVHLMQSPIVAWQFLHRDGLLPVFTFAALVVRIIAIEIHIPWINLLAPTEWRSGSSATGVFPLCFRRQTQFQLRF